MSAPRRLTRLLAAVSGVVALTVTAQGPAAAEPASSAADGFVATQGESFVLDGQPYRFGGTNNYYLHYKSPKMVQDVFDDAAAMNLGVVRAWTMIDRGSLDGSVPNVDGVGHKDGYYMQYWDTEAGQPAVNDTETGLVQLDKMLAAAEEADVRVIMTLTNNWREFGGMDQYVRWAGGQHHDEFYADPQIREWYRNWAATLVNRTNTVTGEKYSEDPNIFSWELANEPRCSNGNLGSSGTCTTETILDWAGEMSAYIKSLDPNHMVSVGDEGFLAWDDASDWAYNANEGVDHEALTSLPNVDFGTFHLYPNHWGKSAEWGTKWINDHMTAAAGYGKPVVLEEFGYQDQGQRDAIYQEWGQAVREGGGDGWNFWILTGIQDDDSDYPDYDGFRVMNPSSTATVLAEEAAAIKGGATDAVHTSPSGIPMPM